MNNVGKVVVIEDEPDIVEVITYNLKREGFQVAAATRGDEGLRMVRNLNPAMVILDLMLPGMDGLSVCREIKSDPLTRDIPVIIVSAKGEESDVVIGLGMGADDYLAKPFGPRELLARIAAVLRRNPVPEEGQRERVVVKDLIIDKSRHEVFKGDERVELTATEFKILYHLAAHRGRAFSREQLLNRVVGESVVVVDRNIDVHIRAVRKKLGDYASMIETIRGVGYRFVDE